MFRSKFLGLAGVAMVACNFASVAVADTVKADFTGVNPGLSIKVESTSSPDIGPLTVWTGVNNWKVLESNSTEEEFAVGKSFAAFCIEINQSLGDPTTFNVNYDLATAPVPSYAMGEERAKLIHELWDNRYDDIFTGTSTDKNNKAAAFQLAIWEIVFENWNTSDYVPSEELNVSKYSGNFYAHDATSTVRNYANSWLGELTGNYNGDLSLLALTNSYKQDMVTIYTPPPPDTGGGNPVPTPMAAGMGLIGFSIIGLRRQRPAKA